MLTNKEIAAGLKLIPNGVVVNQNNYEELVQKYLALYKEKQDKTQNGGQMNMAKISDYVKDYESPQTVKNIADLQEVSTDIELEDDEFEFTDKQTQQVKVVKQKVINVNGVTYRVPVSVIQQLKILMEDNPGLKKFKVKKSGNTKDDTRYQVIPVLR
jgi:hypothetical protein